MLERLGKVGRKRKRSFALKFWLLVLRSLLDSLLRFEDWLLFKYPRNAILRDRNLMCYDTDILVIPFASNFRE